MHAPRRPPRRVRVRASSDIRASIRSPLASPRSGPLALLYVSTKAVLEGALDTRASAFSRYSASASAERKRRPAATRPLDVQHACASERSLGREPSRPLLVVIRPIRAPRSHHAPASLTRSRAEIDSLVLPTSGRTRRDQQSELRQMRRRSRRERGHGHGVSSSRRGSVVPGRVHGARLNSPRKPSLRGAHTSPAGGIVDLTRECSKAVELVDVAVAVGRKSPDRALVPGGSSAGRPEARRESARLARSPHGSPRSN